MTNKYQALEQIFELAREHDFTVQLKQPPDPNCLHCEGKGGGYWTAYSKIYSDCFCTNPVRDMNRAKQKFKPHLLDEQLDWPCY